MNRRRGDAARRGTGLTARGSPAPRFSRRAASAILAVLFLFAGTEEAFGGQDCSIHHLPTPAAHGAHASIGAEADHADHAAQPAHDTHAVHDRGEHNDADEPHGESCDDTCACIGGCQAGADTLPLADSSDRSGLDPISSGEATLPPTAPLAGRPSFFFPYALAPPTSR